MQQWEMNIEIGALPATDLPALALERVNAMPGHRPWVVQRPNGRLPASNRRQVTQAHIAGMDDMQVENVSIDEVRHLHHLTGMWVQNGLHRSQALDTVDKPIDLARHRTFKRQNLWILGILLPNQVLGINSMLFQQRRNRKPIKPTSRRLISVDLQNSHLNNFRIRLLMVDSDELSSVWASSALLCTSASLTASNACSLWIQLFDFQATLVLGQLRFSTFKQRLLFSHLGLSGLEARLPLFELGIIRFDVSQQLRSVINFRKLRSKFLHALVVPACLFALRLGSFKAMRLVISSVLEEDFNSICNSVVRWQAIKPQRNTLFSMSRLTTFSTKSGYSSFSQGKFEVLSPAYLVNIAH